MDFNQIQELIRLVGKSKLSEFTLKEGDFKLVIRNHTGHETTMFSPPPVPPALSLPAYPPPPAPKAEAPPLSVAFEKATAPVGASDENPTWLAIKSPMVGTFYRAATPDKSAYVKLDSKVEVGMAVCMIEAMKLFNEIESEVRGRIVKILVEDGKPVEYDQPLFMVDPA